MLGYLEAMLGRWAILGLVGLLLGHPGAVFGYLKATSGVCWANLGLYVGVIKKYKTKDFIRWEFVGSCWPYVGPLLGHLGLCWLRWILKFNPKRNIRKCSVWVKFRVGFGHVLGYLEAMLGRCWTILGLCWAFVGPPRGCVGLFESYVGRMLGQFGGICWGDEKIPNERFHSLGICWGHAGYFF